MEQRDTLGDLLKWLFTDIGGIVFLIFVALVIGKTATGSW